MHWDTQRPLLNVKSSPTHKNRETNCVYSYCTRILVKYCIEIPRDHYSMLSPVLHTQKQRNKLCFYSYSTRIFVKYCIEISKDHYSMLRPVLHTKKKNQSCFYSCYTSRWTLAVTTQKKKEKKEKKVLKLYLYKIHIWSYIYTEESNLLSIHEIKNL